MTYIVIAALALIALVVIILFFTGGMSALFKKQVETVGATSDKEAIWIAQCKTYCTMGQDELFQKIEFEKDVTCTSLGVECGTVTEPTPSEEK